jgi:bifunctional non-homologous end joining protein LigD
MPRNEKEWTAKFFNIVESVKSLPLTTAILDGEIAMVDAQGHSSFQKLQRAMSKSSTSAFVSVSIEGGLKNLFRIPG